MRGGGSFLESSLGRPLIEMRGMVNQLVNG